MKKLAYVFAALAAIAVAAPTVASAEEFGIRIGGDRDMYRDRGEFRGDREFRGSRAEFRYGEHDRGLHRGWYKQDRNRVVSSNVIVIGMTNRNGPLTGAIFSYNGHRVNSPGPRLPPRRRGRG